MTGRIFKLDTPAVAYPVEIGEMKLHLRVDHSDEDGIIDDYIASATASIGEELGRVMVTETWAESMSSAPRDVYLTKLPADTLVSVTYYDTGNIQQTATIADFALYAADDWAFVRSDSWPAVFDRPDAITVKYSAGYGAADVVPAHLKQAIKLVVGHWYENREDASEVALTEIPRAASHLIGLSRVGWYG